MNPVRANTIVTATEDKTRNAIRVFACLKAKAECFISLDLVLRGDPVLMQEVESERLAQQLTHLFYGEIQAELRAIRESVRELAATAMPLVNIDNVNAVFRKIDELVEKLN